MLTSHYAEVSCRPFSQPHTSPPHRSSSLATPCLSHASQGRGILGRSCKQASQRRVKLVQPALGHNVRCVCVCGCVYVCDNAREDGDTNQQLHMFRTNHIVCLSVCLIRALSLPHRFLASPRPPISERLQGVPTATLLSTAS